MGWGVVAVRETRGAAVEATSSSKRPARDPRPTEPSIAGMGSTCQPCSVRGTDGADGSAERGAISVRAGPGGTLRWPASA